MKMIPGALAALIRYEQIISPNWEVFGDPQVVLVLEGPMGLSETMVRVMMKTRGSTAEPEDDQEFFLVDTSSDFFVVYSVPPGPWKITPHSPITPMADRVGEVLGTCLELQDITKIAAGEPT